LEEIWQGLVTALRLIVTFDPEVVEISLRSLAVSATSTTLAALICVPLATLVHLNRFPGKRALISLTQTLYSVPTVVVGLFVFVLISRAGPLGGLNLIFTPTAMVLGQVLLIAPIMFGLTLSALSGVKPGIIDTAVALGASPGQTARLILHEARFAVLAAVVMGFGRAISEVGLAIMIGGNIRGFTRVITTAISLETSKGELELALALGIILLIIALVINLMLNRIQQR
jgi:tungstate transport system permease protein